MNQSSYIAAFLLAGFVLFLAANNRLSAYAAVLWGTPAGSSSTSSGSANSSSGAGSMGGATTTGGSSAIAPTSPGSSTSGSNPLGAIVGEAENVLNPLEAITSALPAIAGFFGL